MTEPASNEVLEDRLDSLAREHARDRDEMMRRITDGFNEVKHDIGDLRMVHPEVFNAWQVAVEARFNRLDSEVVWNRRLLIGTVAMGLLAWVGAVALELIAA